MPRRRSPGRKVCGGRRAAEESETPFLDSRYSEKRRCFESLAGLFSVTAIARLVCLLFGFLPFLSRRLGWEILHSQQRFPAVSNALFSFVFLISYLKTKQKSTLLDTVTGPLGV